MIGEYKAVVLPGLAERLVEHNRGFPRGWSSRNRPFVVIYSEVVGSEGEVRMRERFLKSGRGREWLRARPAGYPPAAGGAS